MTAIPNGGGQGAAAGGADRSTALARRVRGELVNLGLTDAEVRQGAQLVEYYGVSTRLIARCCTEDVDLDHLEAALELMEYADAPVEPLDLAMLRSRFGGLAGGSEWGGMFGGAHPGRCVDATLTELLAMVPGKHPARILLAFIDEALGGDAWDLLRMVAEDEEDLLARIAKHRRGGKRRRPLSLQPRPDHWLMA